MAIAYFLLPTLAPAIVGSVLYGILVPILIWRTHKSHSFVPYVMITIFSILRVTGFACRAAWSQQLDLGLTPLVYVATVFQYVGFVLEVMAVVILKIGWIRVAIREGTELPRIENIGMTVLRVVVIIAQILTIIGVGMFLDGIGSSRVPLIQTGANLKNAAFYILFVSTVISLVLMTTYFIAHYPQGKWSGFALMMALYTFLLLKLCFRISALNFGPTHPTNTQEVYYYCLDALPEFMICTLAAAVDLTIVKNGFEPWKSKSHPADSEEMQIV